jgi:hypothetical protein
MPRRPSRLERLRGASFAAALATALLLPHADASERSVTFGPDGKLSYRHDERGNRVPNFSTCGYAGGDREIPSVAAAVVVTPAKGDDGSRIQAAIDEVAKRPLDHLGFRGAVVLTTGEFQVAGELRISHSGIVLRGSGATSDGTAIVATGDGRRTLLRIAGGGGRRANDAAPRRQIVDGYVAVGETSVGLDSTSGMTVGDAVLICRPSIGAWVKQLGADAFGLGWRPGSRDIHWERRIAAVQGNRLMLDAPITTAIDAELGGAAVQPVSWPDRISNVGVEDVLLKSDFDLNRPNDEEHAWHGVTFEHVIDGWVRRAEFRHFSGGAVAVWDSARRITVEDCISLAPVSEVGGRRRLAFFTQGEQTLFLRCWSEEGLHDFATGHCTAGPNAFVHCVAARTHGDSGPLESWTSGLLFDNVRIDGGGLLLENRWAAPTGCGWAAANSVLWQCQAAQIRCFRPPGANNWAIGVWANVAGDGTIQGIGEFVQPISLFQAQLRERCGEEAARRIDPLLLEPVGATNPTMEEAARLTDESSKSPRQLIDVIRERMNAAKTASAELLEADVAPPPTNDVTADPARSLPDEVVWHSLHVRNGWLVVDDHVVTGGTLQPKWWAGNIRPAEAPAFGPSITRFVPGRIGEGFTDDLPSVVAEMSAQGKAAYDHHYGLWYDRRRDEHTHVRQADGEVVAPFYEQPFARTGEGAAWDGLSRYDLTRFNPWYWNRLRDFAGECERAGLVLLHQNYFQHNVLEAGAHWADSPWRPANNVNGPLPFPEPPPYVGDKRIFLAETFYDVSHPRLRELHRGYIRQCLDNFVDRPNVIQLTSGEYSGPLTFVQFWIDVVAEWEQETGRDAIVALSAPKDVQDAILADETRRRAVDVIDIRYWAYAKGGDLYAPNGGQNLSPRQHLRQTKLKPGGAAAIVRAVGEYRRQFPGKAITYYAEQNCPSVHDGWATLVGGGSLADVPRLPELLAKSLVEMKPVELPSLRKDQWMLAGPDGERLIYAKGHEPIELELPKSPKGFQAAWIDVETGEITETDAIDDGKAYLAPSSQVLWITPME